jgi:hypothetical protein
MARYAPLTFDTAAGLPAPRSTIKPPKTVGPQSAAPKRGLLLRLFDAIVEARLRQAEREIARYLATRGKWTDQVERESARPGKVDAGFPTRTRANEDSLRRLVGHSNTVN